MARKPEPPATPLTGAQVWWLFATGIAAYLPLAPEVPLWLAVATAAAFVWRAALAAWRQPLPPRWLLTLVSLAGVAGVLLQYRTLFGQHAGVALLLIFLGLKQLEARLPRDGLAIVLLAYFLTLTQFFENQSIAVAFTMIGTVVVATAALANLTDAQARPLLLLRLAGLLLVQSLPFMLVLFVLFPRVSGPLWGLPGDAYSGLTGLGDSMSPGAINNLIQSDAIAFRVKFEGDVPPRQALYWRGPVLTQISGRTWLPGSRISDGKLDFATTEAAPTYRYTVTLEPHNKPWLFALELPLQIPENALASSDYQLLARKPVRERLRYEMRSQPQVVHPPESRRALALALTLPATGNPRTVAAGKQLAATHANYGERVARGIELMRNQRLLYTLRPPLMGENVADEFLFDHKRGFCEHFSASFVVLMRAAGVPARVVTGYQGGERNPVDDTWIIKQSDAHAWAEVWLDERGWVRVDPTATSAPARIDGNLASAVPVGDPLPILSRADLDFLRELRFRWWAMSNAWNQWVLGYNPEKQIELLSRLGMEAPDWRKMTALLAFLSGLALLGLLGAMFYRRPRLDPATRQWRKLTRRLARRGLPPHPWEGPQDYACRIALCRSDLSAEIASISALYGGLRYGRMPRERVVELRRRVRAFKP